ncbi:MAG: hypothetical protein ACOCTH_02750 [Halodesulfurarchaeum sp.]
MPEGAYNTQFEPIARKGDVVEVQPRGFYRVEAVGYQPTLTPEDAFEPEDGDLEKREMTDIEQRDGYLAQYRLPHIASRLPDDVTIKIDHDGRQAPMFEAKNVRGFIDNETGVIYSMDGDGDVVQDDHLTAFTELFVFEDNAPYFTVENTSGAGIEYTPRFSGYQFKIEEVSRSDVRDSGVTPVAVPSKAIRQLD